MSQITNEQEKLIDEFKSGNKDVFPLIIDNIKNSLYKTIYIQLNYVLFSFIYYYHYL